MRTTHVAAVATSLLTCAAHADFIGWTSTLRQVEGGWLVNVFAVTSSAGDRLVSVYGGRRSNPGVVSTTAPGGFLQRAGAAGAFRPDGVQSWDDHDSFLTIGGDLDAASATWSANPATTGDPGWRFTDPSGTPLDGFSLISSSPGVINPWADAVPSEAGWYATGMTAPSRSLASLSAIRLPFAIADGLRLGASSAIAAAGLHGMMVAQLHVTDLQPSLIHWNMGATIRRHNGTAQQGEYAFTISLVPSPAVVMPWLGLACCARRRRQPPTDR